MAELARSGIVLSHVVTFKCDPDWLAAVDELARRGQVTRSEAIRRAVDGITLVEAPDQGYRDLVVQLVKLGTLYNQTVRLAHQTSYRMGTIPTTILLEQLESNQTTLQAMLESVLDQGLRQQSRSS